MLDSLVVAGLSVLALGTIHEADGVVERSFCLRNVGSVPVAIAQGYTSCGCTTIHYDKSATIAPGDSIGVALRFNPRGKGGPFYESGTLVYGTARKRIEIALEGTCITSEETLLRQFPIRVNDSLRLSANRFDLGVMHVGERKERGCVVLHTASGQNRRERIPVVFSVDKGTPKGLQHISYPIRISGQVVNVTLDVVIK